MGYIWEVNGGGQWSWGAKPVGEGLSCQKCVSVQGQVRRKWLESFGTKIFWFRNRDINELQREFIAGGKCY